MPFTNELSLNSKVMALLIGAPGTGKTLAGASFSECGPMSFADFDGRMKPVALHYPKAHIHYKSYTVSNAIDFVLRDLPELLRNCPYKSFQLAGITSLSTALITAQLNDGGGLKKSKFSKIFVPSWDEFSGEATLIGQALDMLRALNCNVFVEAHPVSRTSLTEGKFTSLVAFGPKVASLIPGYFDEIWYFTTELNDGALQYVVNCKPNYDWPLAKTSLPLPDRFILSSPEGKPLSLYQLIQERLKEYDIEIGGNIKADEPEDPNIFQRL